MDEYRRHKNSIITNIISEQAHLMRALYELAGCEGMSEDDKNKIAKIIVSTKEFLPVLEGMMSIENSDTKEESDEDAFIIGLTEGLPKKAHTKSAHKIKTKEVEK